MKNAYADCSSCPLEDKKYCPSYFPENHGWPLQYDPTILWVGQAPGDIELMTKQPFTGPAGKTHYRICMEAGLNKPAFPHINVVNCHPGKSKDGKSDLKPPMQAMLCCEPRLKEDILRVRPGLIVALGEEAMFALTRQRGITSQRGSLHPLLERYGYDCKVYCCLHPSYCQRQRQYMPLQKENYREALYILAHGKKKEYNLRLILDPSPEELEDYLSENTLYAVDTETTGLSFFDDQILGHSFSKDSESAIAVTYTKDDPRVDIVRAFLQDESKKKSWQNGSYDIGILEGAWGITSPGFEYDTRIGQQLLYPDLPSNLEFLRSQYTDIPSYKPSKKEYKNLQKLGTKRITELAAMDAITTYRVMQEQKKKLQRSQKILMEETLIPLVEILNEVEHRGILIDKNMLLSLYMQLKPLVEEREKEFVDLNLNPRSPVQMKGFLNDGHDIPISSTGQDVLKYHIKRNHPKADWMQKLLDYREVDVLYSKYIIGIYNRLRNNRVHTHYKIEGTGTGRLASENPNLQNVPEFFRIIYIPDPGNVFLSADYKQIEIWVLAVLAEEWQMFDDLQNGLDIHFEASKLCFPEVPIIHGDRKKDFTHRQVLIAKTVVFGTAYGRGKRSIAREFGVRETEAERWQTSLLGRWPKLKNYQDKCVSDFKVKGYIKTPFGRIRYVEKATQGLNTPIQSTAADVMLRCFVQLRRDHGIFVPLTVYDDITAMVPEGEWKEKAQIMKGVMTQKFKELGSVGFKVDFKMGHDWYNMEPVKV
jgi:uracil-DNA glycosylase family 4